MSIPPSHRRPMLPALALAIALVAPLGCSAGVPRGVMVTGDGGVVAASPGAVRDEAQRTIDRALAAELGPHWRSRTTIAQLPDHDADAGWWWDRADAAVELIGDGAAPQPLDDAQIIAAVRGYLGRRVPRPALDLRVTVSSAIAPERFAALGPSPAPDAGAASATAGIQASADYVIQAGDTLAQISTAFYGTAAHWRLLLEANPGLDGQRLVVGTRMVIPPAP